MISNEELSQITGGASKSAIITAIIAGVIFIIGVVDGYIRPLKCGK